MERMPSIFNDVLSPVTPGPSSSNTCGPYRIARLARALLGEPPRRITVRMARRGGYYDTFYSMHSHEAILAALLGQELLRCDLSTMCRGYRWVAARSKSPASTAATSYCGASAGRRCVSARRAPVWCQRIPQPAPASGWLG